MAIAAERLARKYHVAVETRAPQIAYRETIAAGTEAHARYKHQTGGHGQFGEVRLRIEPRERGHGVTFEEKVVGGAVPRQFFPAVEKGVREALMRGVSGFPVTDLHVTLYDGSFHAVDSSEASFKTAASMAIRDALPEVRRRAARTGRADRRPGAGNVRLGDRLATHREARHRAVVRTTPRTARRLSRRGARPAGRTRDLHHRVTDGDARPRLVPQPPRTLRSGPTQNRRIHQSSRRRRNPNSSRLRARLLAATRPPSGNGSVLRTVPFAERVPFVIPSGARSPIPSEARPPSRAGAHADFDKDLPD